MRGDEALVPFLWWFALRNTLLTSERRGRITQAATAGFLTEVGELPVRLAELVARGRRRSGNETRLMKLLAVLVEDYDRRHSRPPLEWTPAEKIGYLLETSGRAPADLIPIFGQRSQVSEALNGKRPVSAEQARKLGAWFGVAPGLFI